jgi:RNA polymerase sigma-70 factor (ECF subfamily)
MSRREGERRTLDRFPARSLPATPGADAKEPSPPHLRLSQCSDSQAEDRELVALARQGRTEAYGELVRRYQDRLFHTLVSFLQNAEDALDVAQETFLTAWQALDSFKGDARFFTWLYRIGMNLAIDLKRRQKKTSRLDPGQEDSGRQPDPVASDADPSQALERQEESARVRWALGRVSDEHRAVLLLKDLEGLKYEEIAEVLDIPLGTVRSRLHRARLELRQVLERLGPGE